MKIDATEFNNFTARFILNMPSEIIKGVASREDFNGEETEVQIIWEGKDITEEFEKAGWKLMEHWVNQKIKETQDEVQKLRMELKQTRREIAIGYLEEKIPNIISKLDDLERDLWQILPDDD